MDESNANHMAMFTKADTEIKEMKPKFDINEEELVKIKEQLSSLGKFMISKVDCEVFDEEIANLKTMILSLSQQNSSDDKKVT